MRVLDAIEALKDKHQRLDAWDVLERAARQWLPRGLCDVYFGPEAHPSATIHDLQELIRAGIEVDEFEDKKKQVDEEVERRSWLSVMADYADVLDMGFREIPEMSFPLFINLGPEVFRILARRKADAAIAHAIAMTGDKLFREIMKDAGYIPRRRRERPDWARPESEFVQANKDKARAFRHRFGIRRGEA